MRFRPWPVAALLFLLVWTAPPHSWAGGTPAEADAFAALTAGVTRVGGYRCWPDAIMISSPECVPVLVGSDVAYTGDNVYCRGSFPPVAVARVFGAGRVIAYSEQGYLKEDDNDGNGVPLVKEYDNLRSALNAVAWLSGGGHRKTVALMGSHGCEVTAQGGYGIFVDAVRKAGFSVMALEARPTPTELARYDCVVVGVPRLAFQPADVAAFEDYVRKGGGLLLLGKASRPRAKALADHPLNQLAMRFGMKFTESTVTDPASHCGHDPANPLFVVAQSAPQVRRSPRVLLDFSLHSVYGYRESLFDRYLGPDGWFTAWTFDYPRRAELDKYDVLIVASSSPFAIPQLEIDEIRDFVSNGGGLFLAGDECDYYERAWANQEEDYPLNALAAVFGFGFTGARADRPCAFTSGAQPSQGWEVDARMEGDKPENIITVPENAEVVLEDQSGRPVLATAQYGRGRVAVLGARTCISSPVDTHLINQELVRRLFAWLAEGTRAAPSFAPERRETLAPARLGSGVIRVHGLPPMDSVLEKAYRRAREVMDLITEIFGYQPAGTWHLVPFADCVGGGGAAGYEDGFIVGFGALAMDLREETSMTGVIAHEMAHTFINGRLSNLEESYASLAAYRAVSQIGLAQYYPEPDPEIPGRLEAWTRRAFEQYDPNGDRLDMALPSTPENSNAMFGKGMWVIEELEKQYGGDFMRRYFQFLESEHVKGGLSMQQVVAYMSRVAGEDQTEWFKSFGTWGGGR